MKKKKMNKNEQIAFLASTLRDIAGDLYYPWHGEDAIAIKNDAKEALKIWKANKKGE